MAHWRVQQWSTFARQWLIYDAMMQCPMMSGERVGHFLMGRNKPIFDPHQDVGDHVIVVNTRHVAVKDNSYYWKRFLYTTPTRFGRYRIEQTMEEVHRKDPTRIFYLESRASMTRCLARHYWINRLHLYPEGIETVPENLLSNVTGVIRQVMPVPRRLDQYSKEEIDEFPKLFDWPEDFVLETLNDSGDNR